MVETEHTHEVAETTRTTKTGSGESRTETTRTVKEDGRETERVEQEGQPKQVQPDGR